MEQDALAAVLDLGVRHRDGRHQGLGVRVPGLRVQRVARGLLDEPAEVHHPDDVRDVPDDGEVVRDDQIGEAEGLLELLQQVDHLRLDRDVQRRDRLVADDHVRLQDQRAGDADALALAAGELVRVAGEGVGREADLGEDRLDLLPALRLVLADAVGGHALGQDRLDVLPGVEAAQRVLEDHLETAAERPHLLARQLRQVGAVEDDPAVGDVVQPQDRPAERRLAAARLADQAVRLTGLDGQRDAVDRVDVAHRAVEEEALLDREVDFDVVQFEKAHAGTSAVGRTGLTQRTWCPAARGSVSSGVPVRHSIV